MRMKVFYKFMIAMLAIMSVTQSIAQRGLRRAYFVDNLTACPNDSFNSFKLTIEWTPPMPTSNNVYRVELSDANGRFDNPRTLGEFSNKNFSPKFDVDISFPKGTAGEGYLVRVTSTNPYSQVLIQSPLTIYYITVKSKLKINNANPTITLCPGETRQISVDKTGAASYNWYKNGKKIKGAKGPTYTITEAGTYQAEVDYGEGYCTSSADTKSNIVTASVQGVTKLKLNGGIEEVFICRGGSFHLVANSNDQNLNYEWYKDGNPSPIASGKGMSTYETPSGNSASGVYYLKTFEDGATCKETSNRLEVKIRQDLQMAIEVEGGNIILPGKPKKLKAIVTGAENPTFQWYRGSKSSPIIISGATNSEYEATASGDYTVKVNDSRDCTVEYWVEPSVQLSYPKGLKAEIGYKGYYSDCKTNRVLLGVTSVKAVMRSGAEVELPKSSYSDLNFEWKKDGKVISLKTPNLDLRDSQQNGDYQLKVSYGSFSSNFTPSKSVRLLDSNTDIYIKASYTPSDGGGVINLCKEFGTERLEIIHSSSTTTSSYKYKWYEDGKLIPGATDSYYDATSFKNYYAEISGGGICDFTTNYLSLREIKINASYLGVDPSNPSYERVFLPYKSLTIQTDISGVDPNRVTVDWYLNNAKIDAWTNSTTVNIASEGDYYYLVTPLDKCPGVSSKKLVVRKPIAYEVKIDYLEGGEACNEVKDVKLGLKKLMAVIEDGTSTKTIDISPEYYPYYAFEWYKKDKITNNYEKLDSTTSPTLVISANDEESLTSYYLVVRSPLEKAISPGTSNSLQAGIEKIKPKVKLDQTVSAASFKEIDDDNIVVCDSDAFVLKADLETDTPESDITYQWFLLGEEVASATQSTISVTQEGTYSVEVSGQKCRQIGSNQFTVKYFARDFVKFFNKLTNEEIKDLTKIQFMEGEDFLIRIEGADLSSALNKDGIADGISKKSNEEFSLSKSGEYILKVGLGSSCKINIPIKANAIPLPSETPTIVTPNSDSNRYWNLPAKYMEKPNVEVSIYTQDGKLEFSGVNFKNNSWPTEVPKETLGRAVIYLYIIKVDGDIKEKGTITLFQ